MPTGTRTDVAADMERIFAPLAGRTPSQRSDRPTAAPALRRRRSKAVLAVVGAVGAAAAVAIGYDLGAVPDVRMPSRDAAIPRAARPAEPSPVAQLAIAEPAPVPLAEPALASEPSSDIPAPLAETVADVSPPTITRPEVRARAAMRPDRRAAARDGGAREDDRCTDDECLYRDVLAADRRLRRAYDRAARAGVSSDWLAGVNRRWVRARDRAQDDPDGAIDRYDRLAEALDAERRELER